MKALERRLAKLEASRRGAFLERIRRLSIEELTAELDRLNNRRRGRPADHPVTAEEREQHIREIYNRCLERALDHPVTEADRQRVSAQFDAQLKGWCE